MMFLHSAIERSRGYRLWRTGPKHGTSCNASLHRGVLRVTWSLIDLSPTCDPRERWIDRMDQDEAREDIAQWRLLGQVPYMHCEGDTSLSGWPACGYGEETPR